jgi:hypothetical protein
VGEDEKLEIVFLWMGGDSLHPIEDDLDDYLDETLPRSRRRRLPWPGRRVPPARAAAT